MNVSLCNTEAVPPFRMVPRSATAMQAQSCSSCWKASSSERAAKWPAHATHEFQGRLQASQAEESAKTTRPAPSSHVGCTETQHRTSPSRPCACGQLALALAVALPPLRLPLRLPTRLPLRYPQVPDTPFARASGVSAHLDQTRALRTEAPRHRSPPWPKRDRPMGIGGSQRGGRTKGAESKALRPFFESG